MYDIIRKEKEGIRAIFRGYDSSMKLRKSTFISLLDKIDSNTSYTEAEIKHQADIFINSLLLQLRRKGNKHQYDWLERTSEYILRHLYNYNKLNGTIIKTDNTLLRWYDKYCDTHKFDESLWSLLSDTTIVGYDKNLYVLEPFLNSDFKHITAYPLSNTNIVMYDFNFGVLGETENPTSVTCRNEKCPRYKQCLSKVYKDGYKTDVCNLDDCNKCKVLDEEHILHPFELRKLAEAICVCMDSRGSSIQSKKEDKEYEHIPRPERQDDVIIYYGDRESLNQHYMSKFKLKVKSKTGKSGIADSHASPREHIRKSHVRTLKDGRQVNVKSSVVNKGKTKTTYKLKERKHENKQIKGY